jgi:nitrogen fixation protein FixH
MAAKPVRGKDVFWWLTAFFLVTIAVDGYFIVRAVNTFPGEQVKNAYVLGIDFNRQIERREAQAKRGWSAEVGITGGGQQTLIVRLAAPSGPVSGLKVDVEAILPGRGARTLALAERAPGEYAASLPTEGLRRISLEIVAHRAGEQGPAFEAVKTLEIAP